MSTSTCVQSTSAHALQNNVPSMINSTCVQSTCSRPVLQSNVLQNPTWDDDFWASSAGIEGVEKLIKVHIERRMESACLSKVPKKPVRVRASKGGGTGSGRGDSTTL
ncbi:hypothetical protein KC19_3G101800 [Ceratodon purpureus]|uniref:Uncharacterized protein n=1 Tax=Ceratodon purpureus TaxID=3225 RepID=A0A8T0IJL4_CERPU|nr:hypothetical protein KC19_3G101800 [Ceratodon purpureus]